MVGIQTCTGIAGHAGIFLLQTNVGLGIEPVDQLQFTAAEAEQFDVSISLDVQVEPFEVGQRAALLIMFPVIRIAFELDVGAGLVL